MFFFKKKKDTVVENRDDEDLINQIHGGLKSVVVRASGQEVKDFANELFRRIEYIPVSPKSQVHKVDQKIINQLSECAVVLNKDPNNSEKAMAVLKEIEILLIQREVAYKSSKD